MKCLLLSDHLSPFFMAGALTIFVILVISRFGNGGGIWVLVAPVSGICILVTFLFVMCLYWHCPLSKTRPCNIQRFFSRQ